MQRYLNQIALFGLLVIIMIRPIISESYIFQQDGFSQAFSLISNASPLRSITLDIAILCFTAFIMIHLFLERKLYRFTGLELGLLFIVPFSISLSYASHKRVAITAGFDWLCLFVLAIAISQIANSQRVRQLVLAVILASGGVQIFECVEQVGQNESTWQEYQKTKEEFWAQQGHELDSPHVVLFEKRLQSNEAQGTLQHSNIAGSYLSLVGLAGLGLGIQLLRKNSTNKSKTKTKTKKNEPVTVSVDQIQAASVVIISIISISAIYLTKSKGALASTFIAILSWGIWSWKKEFFRQERGKFLIAGWGTFIAGILIFVLYGSANNGFPVDSIDFRWQYWTTTADLISENTMGIGRENFRYFYTHYKPITTSEEIANPHNLFVQITSDWGFIGLIILITTTFVVVNRLTRKSTEPADLEGANSQKNTNNNKKEVTPALLGLLTGVTGIILYSLLLNVDNPSFVYYKTVSRSVVWFGIFIACCPWGKKSVTTPDSIMTGTIFGLTAFFIHDLINFAFFVPGSATTCFALLGLALSGKSNLHTKPAQQDSKIARKFAYVNILFIFTCIIASVYLVLVPAWKTQSGIVQARQTKIPDDIRKILTNTAQSDLYEPAGYLELAELEAWLASSGDQTKWEDAMNATLLASTRNPENASLHKQASQLALEKARITQNKSDYESAIIYMLYSLEKYPENPDGLVLLGDLYLESGKLFDDVSLLKTAERNYQMALTLDNKRPEWEIIRKFSSKRIEEIEAKILDTYFID